MANTKKYVSLDKLSLYDEKIKDLISKADAAALQSAKDYADGLAVNYDASGAAATAEANAKGYTDVEIGKVNGVVAGVKTTAEQGVADAATAKGAADAAQAAADAAQSDVDALETYVGTFTHDTAKSVVEYINAKTDGIATSGNLEALGTRVTAVEGDVATIKGDYLKGSDKTELEGKITGVQTAVDTEKSRAEGIEAGLRTDINTVMGDYLKAADKTELQGNIDTVAGNVATISGDYLKKSDKEALQGAIDLKAAQTALEAEIERATGVEEGLQNQINTIMNNPDAEGAINSINEFTKYISDHGTIADGFRTDINKNAADIAAEVKRAGEAETALAGRLDVLEGIDHDAYVDADTALKNELNGEIAKKADATALTSAVEALEGADTAIKGRLDAVEAMLGDGENSVSDMIADAKQEAIDAAAGDATTKAGNAETAAKGYADTLNTAMNTRVEALEAIDHDHSNKALLDTYTQTEANLADAVAKKHEHANKDVLDGITSAKVTAWDGAEQAAKTYADGLNTAMTTKVDGIGSRVTVNEGAISGLQTAVAAKAAQSDLDGVSGRVTAIETWHSNFVECSETEIADLFK